MRNNFWKKLFLMLLKGFIFLSIIFLIILEITGWAFLEITGWTLFQNNWWIRFGSTTIITNNYYNINNK